MIRVFWRTATYMLVVCLYVSLWASPALAQSVAFKQALAESAQSDSDIYAFYRANEYQPLWVGRSAEARRRRAALIKALRQAPHHGLPADRYDVNTLIKKIKRARTHRARGALDVEISKIFLRYARDVQTGILIPSRIDEAIARKVPYRDRYAYLTQFQKVSSPFAFFQALPPQSREYARLMKEKIRLERVLASGGWGAAVPQGTLRRNDQGPAVVALRNRLIAKDYLKSRHSAIYDEALEKAVAEFQSSHGLEVDGVAGPATLAQINVTVAERLHSIIVAMERERWSNTDRGARYVLVNIPDFTARIITNDQETFRTRSVVGAQTEDRPTPEFSDVMEYIVINPRWYVPRSITTKEYLPQLQKDPQSVDYLEILDGDGKAIDRQEIDFTRYSPKTFPYSMRQSPGPDNALGLVKFMFPNRHNIYLHDTPVKGLFDHDVRAYSHGCVRLARPFDFAYALLAEQEPDPVEFFHMVLETGEETQVNLQTPLPVHLIYRTAFTRPRGGLEFRRDIYGRDAKIWQALEQAGVVLGGVRS